MAPGDLPLTRQALKDWCLRKLGQGVIKIHISDEQSEDRITEAIERFWEYHFDGAQRVHLKHKITASSFTFAAPLGFNFGRQETLTGGTSGAKALVLDQPNSTTVRFSLISGTFVDGETISGDSGSGLLASSNGVVIGDIDNEYIPIDDSIISITQIISMPGLFGGGLFSFQFQQALQALPIWPKGDLAYYYEQRQYTHLIEEIFIGDKVITFNRLTGRLHIDLDWKREIAADDWLIIEAYQIIDPTVYRKLYGNYFVREYAMALMKQQWGQNLSVYKETVLLGGAKLNGDQIMKQANDRIKELEKDLKDKYSVPPQFFVG